MLNWLRTVFLNEFALISIAAFAGVIQTWLILTGSLPPMIYPLLAGVFTFTFYQVHKWVNYNWVRWKGMEDNIARPNFILLFTGIGFSLALSIYFINTFPLDQLLILLPAFIIGGAYVLPALWYQKRLRDTRLIKIFLIAFTWAWILGVWPAYIVKKEMLEISWYLIMLIGVERMLFIYALTVPFDIRDLWLDERQGTITIPFAIGIKKARNTAYASAILHWILLAAIWITVGNTLFPFLMISTIVLALIIYLVKNAEPDSPDHYFSFYIDGCIILQALMIYLVIQC